MTEQEANEFMSRMLVRFNGQEGIEIAFQAADQNNVLSGPDGHVHFIDPADVIETLTVAETAALAAGG